MWARWYSICCAFWISNRFKEKLESQSIYSSFTYSSSSSFYNRSCIYPHTPPTLWFYFRCLYILKIDWPLGFSLTSKRVTCLWLSSLQKSLNNQNWFNCIFSWVYLNVLINIILEYLYWWCWSFTSHSSFVMAQQITHRHRIDLCSL